MDAQRPKSLYDDSAGDGAGLAGPTNTTGGDVGASVVLIGGKEVEKKTLAAAALAAAVVLALAVVAAQPAGGRAADGGGGSTWSDADSCVARGPTLPAPCTTCRQPAHDWTKVPIFFHGSDPNGTAGGGFTDVALATISRFPIVTLEKWQGSSLVPYTWQEDAWVVAARQIKARNPAITVLVWFDTVHIYEQDTTLDPDLKDREYKSAWETGCTSGNLHASRFLDAHPEYLLMQDDGRKKALDNMGCHIYNYGEPAAQCYWQRMCLELVASGVIDGCGADASQSSASSGWQISKPAEELWNRGHAKMLWELLGRMGNGLLLGDADQSFSTWGHLPVNAAGVHLEHCRPNNNTINGLRDAAVSKPGAILECHWQPSDGEFNDALAAFLIGAGNSHYIGKGFWDDIPSLGGQADFGDHWDVSFERPLGAPGGDATYVGGAAYGQWTRFFGSGTSRTVVTSTMGGHPNDMTRWVGAITTSNHPWFTGAGGG